jgi:hypothetical protein
MVTTTDQPQSLLTSHGFKQSVVLRVQPLKVLYLDYVVQMLLAAVCGCVKVFFFFFWLVVASILFTPVFVLEP